MPRLEHGNTFSRIIRGVRLGKKKEERNINNWRPLLSIFFRYFFSGSGESPLDRRVWIIFPLRLAGDGIPHSMKFSVAGNIWLIDIRNLADPGSALCKTAGSRLPARYILSFSLEGEEKKKRHGRFSPFCLTFGRTMRSNTVRKALGWWKIRSKQGRPPNERARS